MQKKKFNLKKTFAAQQDGIEPNIIEFANLRF